MYLFYALNSTSILNAERAVAMTIQFTHKMHRFLRKYTEMQLYQQRKTDPTQRADTANICTYPILIIFKIYHAKFNVNPPQRIIAQNASLSLKI